MSSEKLTERTAAGFELIAKLLSPLVKDDMRMAAFTLLIEQMQQKPSSSLQPCPACAMPRSQMLWHHTDNLNLCPGCKAPLRP